MENDNSPAGAGRMFVHREGAGELTDAEINRRARELARIDHRSAVSDEDRARAESELRGETLPLTIEDEAQAVRSATRDPSEPVSDSGHEVPSVMGDNEEAIPERLVMEGVDEAQHDLMIADRRRKTDQP